MKNIEERMDFLKYRKIELEYNYHIIIILPRKTQSVFLFFLSRKISKKNDEY